MREKESLIRQHTGGIAKVILKRHSDKIEPSNSRRCTMHPSAFFPSAHVVGLVATDAKRTFAYDVRIEGGGGSVQKQTRVLIS